MVGDWKREWKWEVEEGRGRGKWKGEVEEGSGRVCCKGILKGCVEMC